MIFGSTFVYNLINFGSLYLITANVLTFYSPFLGVKRSVAHKCDRNTIPITIQPPTITQYST